MMKLEHITHYLSPKSIRNYETHAMPTADRVKREDVLVALSYVSSTCKLGVDLYLAKMNFSTPESAIEGLYLESINMIEGYHKIEVKSKDKLKDVLEILCNFAYQDYSRSASSMRECDACSGQKFIEFDIFSTAPITHKGEVKFTKIKQLKTYSTNKKAKVLCEKCRGKGIVRDACVCQGRGVILDRKETQIKAIPVFKECVRCRGRGFSKVKFSLVLRSVQQVWPVKKTVAYQYVRPFFESLVSKCHQEEANAEYVLSRVTKF